VRPGQPAKRPTSRAPSNRAAAHQQSPRALLWFFTGGGVGVRDPPLKLWPPGGRNSDPDWCSPGSQLPPHPRPSSSKIIIQVERGPLWVRGLPRGEASVPLEGWQRTRYGAATNGHSATRVRRPPLLYFFFFFLPFPSFFWMGRGARTTLQSFVSWLFLFRLRSLSVSSSISMSEKEAERLMPHSRPEGHPTEASPGPAVGPPPTPLVPSPGSSEEGASASGGDKSPPCTAFPFTPPPDPPLESGEGGVGSSRGARSSRTAPGGTGSHYEGSPGLCSAWSPLSTQIGQCGFFSHRPI